VIGVGVFAMWMALEPFAPTAPDAHSVHAQALTNVAPWLAMLWIAFRALGSIVAVPIAEELAFRGFLLRKLVDDDFEAVPLGRFTWYSLLISSVLFGLLHGRWLAGSLAGGLFALALYRRGRMMDAIVAHATTNLLITVYVLSTGNWASWS
jgi:CAAX prenyl protease-like protein